ncbi:BamA/TamA family outer membrane protein [Ameyamaea chiangmaiensis]|uniref:BamA/TamA family outer membrane protein n=2 Tax=Ameyamaea chiangmaiensis TaxID=442969 RepID=A0A850PAV2_9PROT|nr:BamA/TamA family outer membrane protein [Ameyamaea chiangmaiensis]MBS4075349.1 BamA/TamA family outer membrane protein [Ameyamaea chiangmaiensis]NVN41194.1 BamA/TamA family outer membrane protein [Ameyamaea chiangmaiensis]
MNECTSPVVPDRGRHRSKVLCLAASGALTALLPGVVRGAETLPYTTTITPSGQSAVDGAQTASSTLVSLQKTRAIGPYALAGRIRGDYDRLRSAAESFGFYDATVVITVAAAQNQTRAKAGAQSKADSTAKTPPAATVAQAQALQPGEHRGDDPALAEWLSGLPQGTKLDIRVKTVTGPVFHLGQITLDAPATVSAATPATQTPTPVATAPVALAPAEAEAFALKPGMPAVASDVLAAQGRLLNTMQEEGHALASVSAPVAYLRPQTRTLDLVFHVHHGPRVNIGAISLDGLERTHPGFIRRRLTVAPGQLYQPSKIEAARQDLASVGVFSQVGVHDSQALAADGTMPLDFTFKEGKRRSVGAEAGFSTDLGGRAGVTWTYRNVFGNAERLRLTALVTGLGGSAQQGLGYDVYADLMKPNFIARRETFSARIEGMRQLFYSYRQTALLARAGLTRPIGRMWNVNYGLAGEQERIDQFGISHDYTIVMAPLAATLDTTGTPTPIDPATHGVRVSLGATPSVSLGQGTSFYAILQATASTYLDLANFGWTAKGRSVVAVRGIVASVQGASTYAIPPDQRLYAGGSATVRGFRYQGVGPQYGNTKYAIGGTSLDAGSVEFRQRILKSFGAAAFADAGQVGTGSRPGQGTLRVGVGGGVRYYTPIGPVRLDVAVPMNRPPRGDKWELYIGLGETF